MPLVAGVRWAVRGKDADSRSYLEGTGATEDAVLAPFSAALRLSVVSSCSPKNDGAPKGPVY
jgi:hypothetical protein